MNTINEIDSWMSLPGTHKHTRYTMKLVLCSLLWLFPSVCKSPTWQMARTIALPAASKTISLASIGDVKFLRCAHTTHRCLAMLLAPGGSSFYIFSLFLIACCLNSVGFCFCDEKSASPNLDRNNISPRNRYRKSWTRNFKQYDEQIK